MYIYIYKELYYLHTKNSILFLDKSNEKWIVIALSRLIWHQTEFIFLVADQSGKGNYDPNLVRIYSRAI